MSKNFLKRFHHPTNIIDSLYLLRLFNFNGLLTYELSADGRTVKLSIVSVILAISNFIFFTICLGVSYIENNQITNIFFKSDVSYFVGISYRISSPGSLTFIIWISLLRKRYLHKTLKILLLIEDKFQNLSIKLKCQRITNISLIIITVTLTYFTTYISSTAYIVNMDYVPSIPFQVSMTLPVFAVWICVFILIIFVYIVKICLMEINKVRISLHRNFSPIFSFFPILISFF